MKNFQFVFFPLCFSINETNNQRTLPPLSISLFLSLSLSLSLFLSRVKRRKNSCSWPQRKKERKQSDDEKRGNCRENFQKSREFFLASFGLLVVNLIECKISHSFFQSKTRTFDECVLSSLISLVFISRSVRQHFLRRNTITHTLYKTPTNARITNTLRVLIHNITINT